MVLHDNTFYVVLNLLNEKDRISESLVSYK